MEGATIKDDLEYLVNQSLGVLRKDAETKKFFSAELAWLEQRLAIWQKHEWRVALIGITSSGKSTLVNAFLTESLLPVGVRPTSNSLVICRRGAKPRGVIHYQGKPSENIEERDLRGIFEQLTDEQNNPNNIRGIKEIELFWPKFRFKSNVALIDTPGLCGYRLERHEELTMQMLLPTVDAVIFLTTAKANPDGDIARYLDIIGAHGKPVVLVQNMIDSIVANLDNGCILRTKAEVAEDHVDRLNKLLSKLNSSLQKTPIIQVSAIWALKGQLNDSRIPHLVEVIESQLDTLEPCLLKGRYQQLYKELAKIFTTESSAGNILSLHRQMDDESSRLETFAKDIENLSANFKQILKNVVPHSIVIANQLISEVQQLNKKDIAEAEALCTKVEQWFANGPKDLGNIFNDFQQASQKIAEELNLRGEDLLFDLPRLPVTTRLRAPVEQKSESHRVKKAGKWNTFKSWFNMDSAYTTRTVSWEELDINAFKRDIEQLTKKEHDWIGNASKNVLNQADIRCRSLREELARRSDSLTAKSDSIVTAERRINISKDLEKICKEIETKIDSFIEDKFPTSNQETGVLAIDEVEMQLSKYVFALVQLAHSVSSSRYRLLRNEMLQRVTRHPSSTTNHALIWGFDGESMERFLSRFWSDVISGTPGPGRGFEVIDGALPVASKIAVALDIPDEKGVDLIADAKKFMRKKTTVFLLLDAEQPAATMNQLFRSGLLPLLKEATGIIFVIQVIRGLENSDHLGSGVFQLKNIANDFQLTVDGVIANDDMYITSVLVDLLFMKGHEIKTINDEEKWIAALAIGDLNYGNYVGSVLRNWRAETVAQEDCDHARKN